MPKSQLELLVLYQDIQLMLYDAEEQKKMGFQVEGVEDLKIALSEMEETIQTRYIRTYERLKTRYTRPIAPVSKDVCLGCFATQPTSYKARAWSDKQIFTCENCGRILYWIH
ncbi:hypothetical protein KAR48_03115 [bacterium]|nr:hypothetical protein [bacterium]